MFARQCPCRLLFLRSNSRRWWQIPYYWAGVKAYDFVAGKRRLAPSYVLSKRKALEEFPMLRGDELKGVYHFLRFVHWTMTGAVVYYDGQTNDARMNVLLACTASEYGADVINHVEATELMKNGEGKLCGAKVGALARHIILFHWSRDWCHLGSRQTDRRRV